MKNNIITFCKNCGTSFNQKRNWQLYCCDSCKIDFNNSLKIVSENSENRKRFCKRCGKEFYFLNKNKGNKQHCSNECSLLSAKISRSNYSKTEKGIVKKKEIQVKNKLSHTERLRKRFPELPNKCQSCGEDRVLDVAHRPGFERNGAWRSLENCTPEKIWILCPTCHALLDRKKYEPKTLGLY